MTTIITITHDDLGTYVDEGTTATIIGTVKDDGRRVRWGGDIHAMGSLLGVLARVPTLDVAVEDDAIIGTIIEAPVADDLPEGFEAEMDAIIAEAERLTSTADRAFDAELNDEGAQRLLRAIFMDEDDRNDENEGEPA